MPKLLRSKLICSCLFREAVYLCITQNKRWEPKKLSRLQIFSLYNKRELGHVGAGDPDIIRYLEETLTAIAAANVRGLSTIMEVIFGLVPALPHSCIALSYSVLALNCINMKPQSVSSSSSPSHFVALML